jgi:hypothetical protein
MARRTIVLKYGEHCLMHEAPAGGAITPGHLVALDATGDVVVNPTSADADAERAFAIENALEGEGIDTAYAADDQVRYVIAQPGVVINALLEDNHDVAINDKLESAGDGTLQPFTSGRFIGVAIEAVDTTGSPTSTAARIAVRVM